MWGGKVDATAAAKPASFASSIPESVLSPDKVREYTELSQSTENKDRVKDEATQLVKEGGCAPEIPRPDPPELPRLTSSCAYRAFGFPWIQVTREDGKEYSFFGSDRFEQMAFFLGREWKGPFPNGRPAGDQKARL